MGVISGVKSAPAIDFAGVSGQGDSRYLPSAALWKFADMTD
jgi:hypothetical protein